jgi:sorbitol/mannitol transport system permease protein
MMASARVTAVPATRTVEPEQYTGPRAKRRNNSLTWGIVGWVVGIVFFFPVLWMVLTSFKTEAEAYTNTPHIVFSPTLSQYKAVFSSGLWPYVANSAFATIVSTILVLLLATPCAFAQRTIKK